MTPYQFAKTACANFQPDGLCLGIRARDLIDCGQEKVARPLEHCLLADRKRCPYFEHVVLPLADGASPKSEPGLQERRLAARLTYGQWVAEKHTGQDKQRPPSQPRRTCPDCGAPLAKGKQFCLACRRKHRRQTYRRARKPRKDTGDNAEARATEVGNRPSITACTTGLMGPAKSVLSVPDQ